MGRYILFGGAAGWLPAAPGLGVEGMGVRMIGLPVGDERVVADLKRICEAEGGEDVGESGRNSWKIGAGKLKIQNPEWNAGLSAMIGIISDKLNIRGSKISLQLDHLLLRGPDGSTVRQTPAGKGTDGAFAMLVVRLPSLCTGGNLRVFKDEQDTVGTAHDFGVEAGTAPFGCHYAVHYASCPYPFEPLHSGYSLSLHYSIHWSADNSLPPPFYTPSIGLQLIRELATLLERDKQFYYFLEENYKSKYIERLGVRTLAGVDLERVMLLKTANDEVGRGRVLGVTGRGKFVFYLARVEREQTFSNHASIDDWDYIREGDARKVITALYNLNGECLGSGDDDGVDGHEIDEEDALNPDGKSHKQLWRGRRSVTYEREDRWSRRREIYHKYILVAWPVKQLGRRLVECLGESMAVEALVKADSTKEAFIQFLEERLSAPSKHYFASAGAPPFNQYGNFATLYRDERSFRHSVHGVIRARSDPQSYMAIYLKLFPTLNQLTNDRHGWDDLMDLAGNTTMWPFAQDIVEKVFKEFPRMAYKFIADCIRQDVPLEALQGVLAICVSVTVPPDERELREPRMQYDIWQAGLSLHDTTLLHRIVGRYGRIPIGAMQYGMRTIKGFFQTAEAANHNIPIEKRLVVAPLIRAQLSILEGELSDAQEAQRPGLKRYPDAIFPQRADDQAFLGGPDIKMYIYGFNGIDAARSFAFVAKQINCAFRMTGHGIGKKAYVEVWKTSDKSRTAERQKELLKEIPVYRRLLSLRPVASEGSREEESETAVLRAVQPGPPSASIEDPAALTPAVRRAVEWHDDMSATSDNKRQRTI